MQQGKKTVTRVIDRPVLVLNRRWEPVGVFDVATAITTVIRDMGWVVHPTTYELFEFEAWCAGAPGGTSLIPTPTRGVPAPEIIVLREYEGQPARSVAFSRRNLARRDGGRCQYCLRPLDEGERTIDHVLPRSRGGATSWENCVLSCEPCNRRKADHTPEEVGMRLVRKPGKPSFTAAFRVPRAQVRESWSSFVKKGTFQLELVDR